MNKRLITTLGIIYVVAFIGSYIFFDAQETVRQRQIANDDYSKPELNEIVEEIFN